MSGSTSFLDWLSGWEEDLPEPSLEDVISDPTRTALISEDMVKGFCDEGALASPRAAGIVPAVVRLFQRAHDLGLRHFLLFQDTHDSDAVEFGAYPPHCVAGTDESKTIEPLKALSFSDLFVTIPKNSISSHLGTGLDAWLEAHPQVTDLIVVGVCTDICVYLAAVHLRVRANVLGQREARIVVPADCVQTYDLPVAAAEQVGALPHDGDLLHSIFLYHMALNGIEVVAHLA